jgi:hypothetical protein
MVLVTTLAAASACALLGPSDCSMQDALAAAKAIRGTSMARSLARSDPVWTRAGALDAFAHPSGGGVYHRDGFVTQAR